MVMFVVVVVVAVVGYWLGYITYLQCERSLQSMACMH